MESVPRRPYKLLILGDAGVGKTALLHRCLHDSFLPDTCPTIGPQLHSWQLPVPVTLITLPSSSASLSSCSPPLRHEAALHPHPFPSPPVSPSTSSSSLPTPVPTITTTTTTTTTTSSTTTVLVRCQLWDTAGQERFGDSLPQLLFRQMHGCMIVFDLTNEESFHSAIVWHQRVKKYMLSEAASPSVKLPVVLVGCKSDRLDQSSSFSSSCNTTTTTTTTNDTDSHGGSMQLEREAAKLVASEGWLGYVRCSAVTGSNVLSAFELLVRGCELMYGLRADEWGTFNHAVYAAVDAIGRVGGESAGLLLSNDAAAADASLNVKTRLSKVACNGCSQATVKFS